MRERKEDLKKGSVGMEEEKEEESEKKRSVKECKGDKVMEESRKREEGRRIEGRNCC